MIDDEILRQLYQCVKAEPLLPTGERPPVADELLAVIQNVRSCSWITLDRSQRHKLTGLLPNFPPAQGAATVGLNVQVMDALPGSTRIVAALKNAGATAALEAAGIVKDEQIWIRIGDKPAEITSLATTLGIPSTTLLDTLTDNALSDAGKYDPGFLRSHAMDGLGIVAVMVFLAIAGFLIVRGVPDRTAKQVVLKNDIQALVPITANDVGIETVLRKSGAFSSVADIVGRYSNTPLAKGAVPTSPDLSAGKLAGPLTNRSIVRLILKPGKTSLPWSLPATVTLLVSPRHNGGTPLSINDAWILALQDNGDTSLAWVAVDSSKLAPLSAALGDADVFVARP